MMKKLWLFLLACVFGLSLLAFAACTGETTYNTAYEQESGGTPGASSEQISLDGVLNESVYGGVRWVRNYAIDPKELANDLDKTKTVAASAAQLNMTAFFRSSGMYAAIDVNNEAGEAAYVNGERDEALNSGVELLFKNYRVKLSPAGGYAWEKKQSGAWEAYTEETHAVLGAQAKTAPLNDAGNTGYTLEFFVPAAALEAMGYDAEELAQGGDTLQLDAVLVTSYGTDATAAARWQMSSLLAWEDFIEFDANGADVYDVVVETTGEKGGSMVAEAALRDYAVPYEDTTILLKTEEGYRLKSFTVNGSAYGVEYIQGGLEKGYVVLPTNMVDEDLHIAAEFEKNLPAAFEADVETMRFGGLVSVDEKTVTFESAGQRYTFGIENGKIAGRLPYGVYNAEVSGGLYDPMKVTFDAEGMSRLRFTYRAFSSDKFGDAHGGYHDYSRVNRENGVIENIDGNSFLPVTNEAFGDSAFTATFRYSQMTKDSRLGIRYIWNEKTNTKNMRDAFIAEMHLQGGALKAGWADYEDNWNNYNVAYASTQKYTLPDSFQAAFMDGDGVSLTVVRTGATFALYAAIAGNEDSLVYVSSFTLDNDTLENEDGHWAVFIWDTANGAEVPVALEEDAAAWQQRTYSVTDATEDANGSVSFGDAIAVGSPVTFTFDMSEQYALLSFTINGEEYRSQVQENKLTLTNVVPLGMTVKAVFGIENYTVNVDLSQAAGRAEQSDLTVVFTSASAGSVYARHDGEGVWKASLTPGIVYDYAVYAFGSFEVKRGTANVTDGGNLPVSITEGDFDFTISDTQTEGSVDLFGELGLPGSFVYTGFYGLEGAEIENVSRFAAETRFHFADGSTMEVQFVRWDATYEFKFMLNDQNVGVNFMLTSERAPSVHRRVLQDDGVWFTLSVEGGVASVWAKDASDSWVQLKTWEQDLTWSGVPANTPIVRVEFRRRYDGTGGHYAVLNDGLLQLGTHEVTLD